MISFPGVSLSVFLVQSHFWQHAYWDKGNGGLDLALALWPRP